MPTKFPADGKTRIHWVAGDDGIADVHAPTVDEIEAGVDISCDIPSGGIDLGVSNATIETGSICSRFVSYANGRTTVAPALTGWRYEQPDDTFWELVEKDTVGFLVIRTGMDYEDDFEAGQMVTVIKAQMSEPAPEFPGGDTAMTFSVNFVLIAGDQFDQKAVVAAGS